MIVRNRQVGVNGRGSSSYHFEKNENAQINPPALFKVLLVSGLI